MSNTSIAVLMTCHNRKQSTLACVDALFHQDLPPEAELVVYLVDDGSTDSTAQAIKQRYPLVKVIQGSGSLFWNRGMCRAFDEAIQQHHDYHLWLNDDTLLFASAISTLLETSSYLEKGGTKRAIIVGSVQDPVTKELTYGGVVRTSWWHPLKYRTIAPTTNPQECDMMNGNCVLVPQLVFERLGNLDRTFTHSIGDFDYALRARQQNCSVWIAPAYVGFCKRNPPQTTVWDKPGLTLRERFKKINQPKGLPFHEHKVFMQRHGGLLWFVFWLMPYVRLFFRSVFSSKLHSHTSFDY